MRVVVVGALYGAVAVGLGAFAAHLGDTGLVVTDTELVRTAVLYQLFHAATMVAMGALKDHVMPALLGAASWAFALGVLLFSGSLYALALGAPSAIGVVTPVGGALLIAGWLLLAVTAARRI